MPQPEPGRINPYCAEDTLQTSRRVPGMYFWDAARQEEAFCFPAPGSYFLSKSFVSAGQVLPFGKRERVCFHGFWKKGRAVFWAPPGPGCRRQVAAEPSRGCAPLPGLPSSPDFPDPGAPPLPGPSWNEPAAVFPSKPIFLAARGASLLTVPCPGSFPSRKGEARRQIEAGSALLPILNHPKASTVTLAGPCWAR